ncbi:MULTISPECIES: inorganic phosphate transporter [Sphingomonas]|jgi:PiT family inorganic phosphate transporter|uniref:inorganic phosphate transporter n=1 Tax=Sphingomonas TaxID=13687 RepID=UPI001AE2A713
MATTFIASPESATDAPHGPRLDHRLHPAGRWIFLALLAVGLGYAAYSIFVDTAEVGEGLALGTFVFLGLALVIALGFEFVNGFHDTANAVATVIYTHSMPAPLAVVWSGCCNFLGVMLSSGAVAYSIITLLPVELILHVGSNAGFAMIFALLLAAVIWNLATWYFGIPNSSSHALIGSIIGVGFANQLLSAGRGGTSGVDWSQAVKVFSGLLFSPLMGFIGALVLLWIMKRTIRNPKLYSEPEGNAPPPRGIRALLIGTCTAVSFFHGSNDGQKGMGLIMLILIGCAPTAYALNRTMPQSETPAFVASVTAAGQAFAAHASGTAPVALGDARATLTQALQSHRSDRTVFSAISVLSGNIAQRIGGYGSLDKVPAAATPNLRNDMYLLLDSARLAMADKGIKASFSEPEQAAVAKFQSNLEKGTRYIPVWVKVIVALALGLGTMVGWRRIVITVGEKIGKTHLTYGMGAAAEIVAAVTIAFADRIAVPVSTTHILTSGVAGASVASGAGLQIRTIFNMVLAWVMTLPAAMLLSGSLYWIFLELTKI